MKKVLKKFLQKLRPKKSLNLNSTSAQVNFMGMMLIVGLGNPGKQYSLNRHNIGFRLIDAVCEQYGFSEFHQKDKALISEGKIGDRKVLAIKPLTYMNLSGQAVGALARFYKIPPEDVVVIHDDIDLKFSQVRVKQGGGHGGHNGLKSIDSQISKNYWRLRFGVGHPGHRELVTGYVLNNFSKAEENEVPFIIMDIVEAVPLLVQGKHDLFMNKVTNKNSPPKKPAGTKNGI